MLWILINNFFQLSPEDFAQADESGEKIFSHLAKLRNSAKVTYLPYVQSPIKALKHIDASVSEVFIDSIKDQFTVPKTDILIVKLNDADEAENRIDMLKRHGEDIFQFISVPCYCIKCLILFVVQTALCIRWSGTSVS